MVFFWDDPLGSLLVLLMVMVPANLPMLPGLAMAFWARRRIAGVVARVGSPPVEAAVNGAEAASAILQAGDAAGRTIVEASTTPANFYDPSRRELRLSPIVFGGRTPEALGIAAHEAGHAIQDARGYWPARLRVPLVLGARLGSGVAWMAILSGLVMLNPGVNARGATLYSASVLALLLAQVIERDARRRSLAAQTLAGLDADRVGASEPFQRAFEAAGWTDIAATWPDPRALWSRRPTLFG